MQPIGKWIKLFELHVFIYSLSLAVCKLKRNKKKPHTQNHANRMIKLSWKNNRCERNQCQSTRKLGQFADCSTKVCLFSRLYCCAFVYRSLIFSVEMHFEIIRMFAATWAPHTKHGILQLLHQTLMGSDSVFVWMFFVFCFFYFWIDTSLLLINFDPFEMILFRVASHQHKRYNENWIFNNGKSCTKSLPKQQFRPKMKCAVDFRSNSNGSNNRICSIEWAKI